MVREINKLSARKIMSLAVPGRHSDGGGLYLVVDKGGSKRWVFLFRWRGKLKEMGLGGVTSVSLADAREKASAARKVLADGLNPIEVRRGDVTVPAFGAMAEEVVNNIAPGLRNAKHLAQWRMTLSIERTEAGGFADTGYCLKLRNKLVSDIGTDDVLEVLQPIWTAKAETAGRVRGRIERVLDAAKAKGVRSGENPARWRGHLDTLLSRRQKLQRGHHAALPYAELPELVGLLRKRAAVAALALEFLILTAARTGEVIGATPKEIDRTAKVWTIPANRMKNGRTHRVPLSSRALEILDEVQKLPGGAGYLFPGGKPGKPLSSMAMLTLLQGRMKRADLTAHGFRSSFRDWRAERTNYPREIAEAALAHTVGDEVERAYRRTDALEQRRALMDLWANFVESARGSNVVAFPAGGA